MQNGRTASGDGDDLRDHYHQNPRMWTLDFRQHMGYTVFLGTLSDPMGRRGHSEDCRGCRAENGQHANHSARDVYPLRQMPLGPQRHNDAEVPRDSSYLGELRLLRGMLHRWLMAAREDCLNKSAFFFCSQH